jgi:hypothetical protein
LALIEVGSSAGLCLIPDRYGYDYGRRRIEPPAGIAKAPVFPCAADAATPIPNGCPPIMWRAGLDLHPVDVGDPVETAWLETLVWPEDTGRLTRLRQALTVAADDPPRVIRGDLRHDLAALAAKAPKEATLVVFHTAVLAYVAAAAERAEFAERVASLCDFWIANEAPGVMPGLAAPAVEAGRGLHFILSVNGAAVARSHPHGATLEWLADPPQGYRRNGPWRAG